MSEIVLKNKAGIKQTYSGVKVIRIADGSGKYNNYVSQGDAYALFGTWDLPEKTVMYDALQYGIMPDGTTVDNKVNQNINFDVQVYYYSEGEYYYSENKITGFTGFSNLDTSENVTGNFYYKKGDETTVQTFSAYDVDWIDLNTDEGSESGEPRRIIFGNTPQMVSESFYNWFTGIANQIDGGGESIPDFSEVEGFTVFLDEADKGTITVAYSTPQTVKLPAPSGSAQAVRLGSVDDDNFIPSNIKKDVSIFGLRGTYEGEGGTDSPLPIEVSTEDEMTALLESGEIGGIYKYTGTTGTYENGAYYVLEEA